jgi:hypothetical protein
MSSRGVLTSLKKMIQGTWRKILCSLQRHEDRGDIETTRVAFRQHRIDGSVKDTPGIQQIIRCIHCQRVLYRDDYPRYQLIQDEHE